MKKKLRTGLLVSLFFLFVFVSGSALAAKYTPKGPLEVPRVYQTSTGECHMCSVASVQAYVLGSYSYGSYSRTYSGAGDYVVIMTLATERYTMPIKRLVPALYRCNTEKTFSL